MKQEEKKKPMTRSDAGKLGAAALNADPEMKSEAAKKAAQTRKAVDPHAFAKMGRIGGNNRHKKREAKND